MPGETNHVKHGQARSKLSITATNGTEILQVQVMCVDSAPMLHFPTLVNRQVVEATVTLRAKEALDEIPAAISDVDGIARTELVTAAHATRGSTTATPSPS